MTYKTIMVRCELGQSNAGLLQIGRTLADRFGAGIVGIAACQPLQLIYNDGMYTSAGLIDDDREERAKELREAEAEFRTLLAKQVSSLDWRSTVTSLPLSQYVAHEARCADIIITNVASSAVLDASRRVNTGDLIMQAGRPVLIVSSDGASLNLDRMVIAWKDTREARRAVIDALPLLKKARHVCALSIVAEHEQDVAHGQLRDIADWLAQHEIDAKIQVTVSSGHDGAQLDDLAREQAADIIIAGAYGHSRLREWALGGVTKDLLLRTTGCSLVSH